MARDKTVLFREEESVVLAATEKAKAEGATLSDVLRAMLREFIDSPSNDVPPMARDSEDSPARTKRAPKIKTSAPLPISRESPAERLPKRIDSPADVARFLPTMSEAPRRCFCKACQAGNPKKCTMRGARVTR